MRTHTFTTGVFYSSSLLLFCSPFLPHPLKPFLPSSHTPLTEDSPQLLTSTDASFSTVTNGMWAYSCLPAPLLPSTQCSESDLWRTHAYDHVSQSLDPVCEDVCTFIHLPFSIVSLCFSKSVNCWWLLTREHFSFIHVSLHSLECTFL